MTGTGMAEEAEDKAAEPGHQASQEDRSGRIIFIDALRGVALFAMVAYHLSWLTNLFGYTEFDLFGNALWLAARTAILSSFLLISGFLVGLAHDAPHSWPRWFRRVGLLVGAAALVSIGTLYSFPDEYIFFGVLHCLSVSAVLALVFVRLPWWGIAVAAAVTLILTHLPFMPTFDQPWLLWLGLVSRLPVTNDYVPIFPWFGVVLAGMAAGKLAGPPDRLRRAVAGLPAPALLAWPGRHTLVLYLIHPPLFLGILIVLAKIMPAPALEEDTSAFVDQCMAGCLQLDMSPEQCSTYCGCVLDGLHQANLWMKASRRPLTARAQRRLIDITLDCRSVVLSEPDQAKDESVPDS